MARSSRLGRESKILNSNWYVSTIKSKQLDIGITMLNSPFLRAFEWPYWQSLVADQKAAQSARAIYHSSVHQACIMELVKTVSLRSMSLSMFMLQFHFQKVKAN